MKNRVPDPGEQMVLLISPDESYGIGDAKLYRIHTMEAAGARTTSAGHEIVGGAEKTQVKRKMK